MQRLLGGWLVLGFSVSSALGCGTMGESDAASGAGRGTTGGAGTVGAGGSNGGLDPGAAGRAGSAQPPPPEVEVEKAFEAPVATERYVWATNPKTGRVALVDAKTFQVKTVGAGQGPTFIAALPGKGDRAIVINVVSNDATYLSQGTDGALEVRTYQLAPRANSWAISADGRWAIAWTDVTRVLRPDVIEGFQQVSIIDLDDAAAPSRVPVRTVGFRPSSISFAADPPRVFAITEDGITVIDLSTARDPKVLRTIKLAGSTTSAAVLEETLRNSPILEAGADGAADPDAGNTNDADDDAPVDGGVDGEAGAIGDADAGVLADVTLDAGFDAPPDNGTDARTGVSDAPNTLDARSADANAPDATVDSGPTPPQTGKADVSITPDGAFAIFRREGSAVVTAIDLTDGSRWSWTLAGAVTDLDLADTGRRAVAVLRNEGRIAILPVPGRGPAPFDDVLVAGETVGSVVIAPHGEQALLYTNASPVNRITVLGLASPPVFRPIELHAPVLSVFPSSTAEHAVIVHNSFNGQAFKSAGAFSVISLAGDQTPVIQATDAPIVSVAISPAGDRAIIPIRDDTKKIYAVYLARLPSLVVDRYPLATPPVAAGFVGTAGYAFVAQEHPAGRVSFIDADTEQVRTITGFELGAGVVEWTKKDGGK
jgi:hypothetical protein